MSIDRPEESGGRPSRWVARRVVRGTLPPGKLPRTFLVGAAVAVVVAGAALVAFVLTRGETVLEARETPFEETLDLAAGGYVVYDDVRVTFHGIGENEDVTYGRVGFDAESVRVTDSDGRAVPVGEPANRSREASSSTGTGLRSAAGFEITQDGEYRIEVTPSRSQEVTVRAEPPVYVTFLVILGFVAAVFTLVGSVLFSVVPVRSLLRRPRRRRPRATAVSSRRRPAQ